jgi:Fur family peroxide stress response transcriptional regulator
MDEIIQQVQSIQPHIATGTIYNTIDLFIEKNIIKRMKTESGNMRFDSETKHHHHLVQVEPNQIKDYFDDELDELLREYFTQKQLDDFEIESIKVEIQGKFK